MKRILVRFLLLLAFITAFLAAVGFDLGSLLDLRGILGVALGSAIMGVGSWYHGMTSTQYAAAVGRSSLPVALIIAFLYLFEWLFTWAGTENLVRTVALCSRPILYGLILYAALSDTEKSSKPEPINSAPVAAVNFNPFACSREAQMREFGLTEREIEICLLICTDLLPNRKIGERLFISEATVKKHTNNIYRKLNINCRDELCDFLDRNALKQQ